MNLIDVRLVVRVPVLFHLGWALTRVGLHRLGWWVMLHGADVESVHPR